MENQNIHKFYFFRETAKNGERCIKPCFTNGKCGWREPKKELTKTIKL